MTRILTLLLALGLLAACTTGNGSNPFDEDEDTGDDGDGGATEQVIPEQLAGDVTRVQYDPAQNTIVVEGLTLDDVPFEAVYSRAPALEANVPGYRVYTAQDDPLDRHSTALVREAANGAVRAGTVVTGGPRNRYFGGTYYERDGAFNPPQVDNTSGLVTYTGTYAGLTNVTGSGEDLLPVPPGTDPALPPTQSAEVAGRVFVNADFADNSIEGNVVDRVLVDTSLGLPDLVLVQGSIDEQGTFFGTVEFDARHPDSGNNPIGSQIGSYGGVIGGPDGNGLAGTIRLDEWDGLGNQLGFENEEEYGVFVLERCGTAGVNDPLGVCPSVN